MELSSRMATIISVCLLLFVQENVFTFFLSEAVAQMLIIQRVNSALEDCGASLFQALCCWRDERKPLFSLVPYYREPGTG